MKSALKHRVQRLQHQHQPQPVCAQIGDEESLGHDGCLDQYRSHTSLGSGPQSTCGRVSGRKASCGVWAPPPTRLKAPITTMAAGTYLGLVSERKHSGH